MSESTKLHECMMEGLHATWHIRSAIRHFWSVVGTLKVLIGTFRVPNGTWPRHDAHAMVGRLLTLFPCMFRIF